jgi:8-oxo-dGTP pyrophosphatase MutT (NUDIX family)
MEREFSAGGVVLRRRQERWWVAIIEPENRSNTGPRSATILALPKGNVDPGEKPEQTAVREVREETGLEAEVISKLSDIKYVYVRSWGDRQRVFKIVSFFLLRYRSGRIGNITPVMRGEVRQALWLPLEEAPQKISYRGERDVIKVALEYVAQHPQL